MVVEQIRPAAENLAEGAAVVLKAYQINAAETGGSIQATIATAPVNPRQKGEPCWRSSASAMPTTVTPITAEPSRKTPVSHSEFQKLVSPSRR